MIIIPIDMNQKIGRQRHCYIHATTEEDNILETC